MEHDYDEGAIEGELTEISYDVIKCFNSDLINNLSKDLKNVSTEIDISGMVDDHLNFISEPDPDDSYASGSSIHIDNIDDLFERD